MKDFDASGPLCVASGDLAWRPSAFAKGVAVKDIGSTGGMEMQLVRFEPGAQFPVHTHGQPEFLYVLEGELIVAGERITAGWASLARAGSVHSEVRSETGCVFVLVDQAS